MSSTRRCRLAKSNYYCDTNVQQVKLTWRSSRVFLSLKDCGSSTALYSCHVGRSRWIATYYKFLLKESYKVEFDTLKIRYHFQGKDIRMFTASCPFSWATTLLLWNYVTSQCTTKITYPDIKPLSCCCVIYRGL